jgi:predicted transcriptional regulator
MKVDQFQKLPKVTTRKSGIGKKTDWSVLYTHLQKNKDLAYTVKECHDYVNANAMIHENTNISRVRVYKELEKLYKKGKVTKRVDDAGTGYYNWNHIQAKTT